MRGRFGRRRRRDGGANGDRADAQGTPVDPSWLIRVAQAGFVDFDAPEPAEPGGEAPPALVVAEVDGLEPEVALVARGQDAVGRPWTVGVSPRSGGDALFAALAGAEEGSRILAVSEHWDDAALRRLGRLGALPAPPVVRTLRGDASSEPEPAIDAPAVYGPWEGLEAGIAAAPTRARFRRALQILVGLAAKHAGSVRGAGGDAELMILAGRAAALRTEGSEVVLESWLNGRENQRLEPDTMADAFDRLEGLVRKRVNDRRVREGEEGLRGRGVAALEAAEGLLEVRRWPLGGPLGDALDVVGAGADGIPVVGAVRADLTIGSLGRILDAALALEPLFPALFASGARSGMLRLAIAAERITPAAERVARHLTLPLVLYALDDQGATLSVREHGRAGGADRIAVRSELGRPAGGSGERAPVHAPRPEPPADAGRGRRSRGRRRRGRGGEPGGGESAREFERAPDRDRESEAGRESGDDTREAAPSSTAGSARSSGYDELSLFDVDLDDSSSGDDGGARRRRGRRGRGRRTRSAASGEDTETPGESPDADRTDAGAEPSRGARRGGRRRGRAAGANGDAPASDAAVADDEDAVDEDELLELSPDAPDLDEASELVVRSYDDDEEEEPEPESEADRIRLEREKRRLARLAKAGGPTPAAAPEVLEPDEGPALPRGRVALLAHADRASIAAAILLAREWRQVEGLWIYPQEELMTFFRGPVTDLRENSPILVVGFEPHPARDVIQAAQLCSGRIAWFDHHAWPPEDRNAMAEAIHLGHLHLAPGARSVLPAVLPTCERRSRFSDKLVDLVTGRFSAHDFERWGRLWWYRLGELAKKQGENRSGVESLLAGRPSDLAKEASKVPAPPLPDEVGFVEERDFRLVHFGGLALAVVDVPLGLDVHLVGRLVRERYGALLSLGRREGDDVFVLGADDVTGRGAIDVGGMVAHLDEKFGWIEALPDADHVARFHARDLERKPGRIDDIIAEIGMGRSILEG